MIVIGGEPSVTDWIAAVSAIATFAVALWALFYAKRQIKEASESRKQVDAIEKKRAEPAVIAFMEPAASQIIQELVIKNYGQTPAYDVKLLSNPPIQRTADADRAKAEDVDIPEIIPYLAPGQEWRTIWDSGHERAQNTVLADRHEVTVTFKGIDDEELRSHAILDWGPLKSKRFMDTYGIHHLAKATREMNNRQKKWGPLSGGLNVWFRDGDAKDERAERARAEIEADPNSLMNRFGFGKKAPTEEPLEDAGSE